MPSTTSHGCHCCIPSCKHVQLRNRDVSYHSFPKDPSLREQWVQAIIQNTALPELWQPKPSHKICGAHFNVCGKKQYMDKVPRLLKPGTFIQTCPSQVAQSSPLDVSVEVTVETSFEEVSSMSLEEDVLSSESEHFLSQSDFVDETEGSEQCSKLEQLSRENEELRSINLCLLQEKADLQKSIAELHGTNAANRKELQDLRQKLSAAEEQFLKEQQALSSQVLDLERKLVEKEANQERLNPTPLSIARDTEKLQFYTGFKTVERFKRFYEFVHLGYENYRKTCSQGSTKSGRPQRFNLEEQLILVLIRLRVGLLERDLAYRYSTSRAYISEMLSFWTEFLSEYLSRTPIWPSRETVNDFMPPVFKESYPSTRVILDCTELYIETPSDFRVQSDTYSVYKSHNTAKGLIGIAPNGFVTFVSNLAPGRISDRALVKQSGLYDLLEEGDSVMADRGFIIAEDLATLKVDLNIPPFLNGAPQLSVADELRTRSIAKARIHVERVIRQRV
ncbi:uncharacterized protein LOC135390508 [Ornithodoros turicata]|uniref:uncharacterized protein LOC135390508 n=1 Tax=Ornithodoros turicata TaxID=34597 RepID=UPI003138D0FC